ncbi:hypothetical protein BECAL_00513 [Bellilinea caldifistulae]|uniref:Uncharacterized protein n=2 Tax=Bellilinea caldifistulae TaxID=360411 RepID=A0A0P6XJU9_9CHLR|nr:hypothetical protein [Bellilinea caldifistulae]KPL75228.1 hypothetical protein AC812_09725 [Bellilinea caldifistulae]GAP09370.1 hypothetical protein BECAL_00513 [Bellilinea caldifistulae]
MFSLSIILPDSPAWVLQSSVPQPPLEGLRWLEQHPSQDGGEVIECAVLGLHGAGIREWLEGLQAVLAAVSRTPFAVLERRIEPADEPLYASLYEGWLESDPLNQRPARGGYSLRLYLRRAADWRKPAAALPLTNANGVQRETGLAVYNHHDGDPAHQNFADIRAADLSGGQPAPLSLRLRLLEPMGETLRQVILAAGSRLTWGGEAFLHSLEGESAAAGPDCTASNVLNSGAASGGAYRRVQWTRSDSASLLRWTLSAERLGFCAGRLFRPVLRLFSPPPEGVYLRWRLLDGNANPLEESPDVAVQTQRSLQVTGGLHLPPGWLPQITPAALTLELRAESRDTSLKTLEVDFVHLLPTEGWLELHALNGASASEVWVDGERQIAYSRSSAGETAFTHALTGSPLHLLPGSDYRLYLLWETESGAPLTSRCEVQAFYAPRVKLP